MNLVYVEIGGSLIVICLAVYYLFPWSPYHRGNNRKPYTGGDGTKITTADQIVIVENREKFIDNPLQSPLFSEEMSCYSRASWIEAFKQMHLQLIAVDLLTFGLRALKKRCDQVSILVVVV